MTSVFLSTYWFTVILWLFIGFSNVVKIRGSNAIVSLEANIFQLPT